MPIREQLRNILKIIADLAHNDTNVSVKDTAIIRESTLPRDEVNKYLNELQSLELVKEQLPRPAGTEFSLWNITREGLEELLPDQNDR